MQYVQLAIGIWRNVMRLPLNMRLALLCCALLLLGLLAWCVAPRANVTAPQVVEVNRLEGAIDDIKATSTALEPPKLEEVKADVKKNVDSDRDNADSPYADDGKGKRRRH